MDYLHYPREFVRCWGQLWVSLGDLEDEVLTRRWGSEPAPSVIFGVTGGVMEAALRSAFYFAEGKSSPDDFSSGRERNQGGNRHDRGKGSPGGCGYRTGYARS